LGRHSGTVSAFKLLEGPEIRKVWDTLKASRNGNRFYIISLVKVGVVIDHLDKMMSKVKKETFGSQCLKEITDATKKRTAETQHPKLCAYVCYQFGKIAYMMRDFRQAKVEFRVAYDICEVFYDRYLMLKCSEWLGKTYSMLKLHERAINHFSIMLHMSWIENDRKYENRSYDHLG
jgi:hypothetical protein